MSTGVLAASGDLGNFSGYAEGDADYEKLITAVHDATLGAGKRSEYDVRDARRLAQTAARTARSKKATQVCVALPVPVEVGAAPFARIVADGAITGLSGSNLYKDSQNEGFPEQVLLWFAEASDQVREAVDRGARLGQEINFGRWLGDEPSNVMTPVRFADEVSQRAANLGVVCEVLDEEAIRAGDMLSLLSVSQGSECPPRVVVLRDQAEFAADAATGWKPLAGNEIANEHYRVRVDSARGVTTSATGSSVTLALAAMFGGASELTYVTESGRRIKR